MQGRNLLRSDVPEKGVEGGPQGRLCQGPMCRSLRTRPVPLARVKRRFLRSSEKTLIVQRIPVGGFVVQLHRRKVERHLDDRPNREIGEDAFRRCTRLETLAIPASLEYVGRCAFVNCFAMKAVTLPAGVTLGENAFGENAFHGIVVHHTTAAI
jgi:hypothetical protein